jgi:cobalt-zinc-cadmium efflux system protein
MTKNQKPRTEDSDLSGRIHQQNREHHREQSREHHHEPPVTAGGNIAFAFFLNVFFCVIEFVGGLFTNSIAIMSDALHDLGDSISLGLAWYFQKVSGRKPNYRYTYGYKRFSTFSALLNSLILLFGSGFVLFESFRRLLDPVESNAQGMLILAVLGVMVNGAAILRLRRGKSLNERVVSLHTLEDVLGWVAVLIASIIMLFVDVPVLDPILSIGISVFVLYNVCRNLKSVLRVILQGKPDAVDGETLRNCLLSLPGVQGLHDWHIWTLDNEFLVLTVHLVISDRSTKEEQQSLRAAAHDLLKVKGVQHSTIEIEYASENCEWCEPD